MQLTTAANKTSRKSWLDENQADVEARIKIHNESVVSFFFFSYDCLCILLLLFFNFIIYVPFF